MRRPVAAVLLPGLLLAGVLAAQTGAPPARPASVNFNFDQVEVRLLVKLVGEMTGKRFVVDNTVTGRVTVVTPPQIPVSEVYPLFLAVLESSGYSVVERERLYHIVALPERSVPTAPVAGSPEAVGALGVVTKVLPVQNVSALELRKILEPMVRGGKAGALAALEQTNHLLITDTRENIARIEQIVRELDKPGAARSVEMIKLEHASAEEVANQLNAALRGSESSAGRLSRQMQQLAGAGSALPTDAVVVPAPQANTLLVSARQTQLEEIKRLVKLMDVEPPSGAGRLNAVFLKYLSAADAAKGLTALMAKTVDKDQRQRIAIEPSVANNALMVDASPSDFELVRALVSKLDLVPQQVLVEILIAEVSLDKGLDLGVEWNAIDSPADGRTTLVGNSDPKGANTVLTAAATGAYPQGLALGVARGTMQIGTNLVPRVPFLLRALASDRNVKILSNVPLWAQNNVEASVSVVNNIPILKSTIEGGAGTARDVIQNIDRMDVGIKLKLTAQVNPNNEVMMKLSPSIEAIIDAGPTGKFAPTIAKREVNTTVTVPDQATIVISGLLRNDRTQSQYKIPLLGDIPLLGFLFRSTSDKVERTNLLIFVTPHIVTDMRQAEKIKQALESRTEMSAASNAIQRATFKK
ncbi:MAG: hypothetical protein NTV49_03850 [Kiritimatiellaeota bacterium]|nr:hypothetical protein [Kiritimatiellota bacterium]